MAGVYMGESGHVELRRNSLNVPLSSSLQPSDVNVPRRRFSFDFDPSAVITGDQLEISRIDGGNLELVAGHAFPDGRWFCHVDSVGGVRLFNSYADALNGDEVDALPLVLPSADQQIEVQTASRQYRCLAGMTDWSLTTNRDAVDLTSLGEEHRRFYANGLMSGQGSLTCFWDYRQTMCGGDDGVVELPHYMAQLVLRCQLGSEFLGRFYIKTAEALPVTFASKEGGSDYIWWEADCVITNVGMGFRPGQPITTSIEFITTGPVSLRMGTPPRYLLQEDGSLLLQEDGSGIRLEND